MLVMNLNTLESMLFKTKVRRGKSIKSEARTIARNQALRDYITLKGREGFHERISKIRDIVLGLNKPIDPEISPFNPSEGFYVVDFEKMHKGIKIFLRGQNLYHSIFCLLNFILREVYDAHTKTENNCLKIYCGSTQVGIGAFYNKEKCVKIKIGEFSSNGKFKKHEQLLIKFWQEKFLITILMFCSGYIVEKIISKLKEKREDYLALQVTQKRIFLKTLQQKLSFS